jgi:hypothetical protein
MTLLVMSSLEIGQIYVEALQSQVDKIFSATSLFVMATGFMFKLV